MNSLGINKEKQSTRVIVAMSGGVDSSVAAALLKSQGYEVIGLTMQLYDNKAFNQKGKTCCAGTDIMDARKVAAKLDIPHYVINFEKEFKEQVINDFINSYEGGITPIPCIRCNEKIKFQDLIVKAKELSADCLATGHYVKRIEKNGHSQLHIAEDINKDQSYFLFTITEEQLDFLRFPLGDIKSKDETRELASKYGLNVANKKDSQDICFIPNGSYAETIKKLRPNTAKPGSILNDKNVIIGEHQGIINYTVGQRKGIGINSEVPLFVTRINANENTITVGPRESLKQKELFLKDINWLGENCFYSKSEAFIELKVKTRYQRPSSLAKVFPISENKAKVVISSDEDSISPGQACVFYSSDSRRILGGGWITNEHYVELDK